MDINEGSKALKELYIRQGYTEEKAVERSSVNIIALVVLGHDEFMRRMYLKERLRK